MKYQALNQMRYLFAVNNHILIFSMKSEHTVWPVTWFSKSLLAKKILADQYPYATKQVCEITSRKIKSTEHQTCALILEICFYSIFFYVHRVTTNFSKC